LCFYNYLDFYAHGTVKMLSKPEDIYTEYESDNLRKYLLSAGYVLEIVQNIIRTFRFVSTCWKTQEKSIDINMKAYKNMDFGTLWESLSYRRSFDGQYTDGNGIANKNYNISPNCWWI
jgi:hypothetical protein